MKERIEALERELAALKAQLKYEPKVGKYAVQGDGTIYNTDGWESEGDYKGVGRSFDTIEKAEKARDIMVKHDIILKYVIDHAPDYEPTESECHSVYFDATDDEWYTVSLDVLSEIGTIVMPGWLAKKLADDLNNNRIDFN